MPAPQFMSKINQQQRLSRTSPADTNTAMPDQDDRLHAVHEYKKCMEDVKNEHPCLSFGAQQQLALERCAKMREDERGALQKKQPADLLRGMMSKLRIGRNQTLDDDAIPAVGVDELGSTISSSAEGHDYVNETKRRSLAVRQSVASVDAEVRKMVLQSVGADLSESENDESLQDSLDDIERNPGNIFEQSSSNSNGSRQARRPLRASLRDSKKSTRRLSALSLDLSDVEKDAGSVTSNKKGPNNSFKGRSDPSFRRKNQNNRQSVTDILPDEIKFALEDFRFGDKSQNSSRIPMPAPSQNRVSNRRSQLSSVNSQDSDEHGNNSSFTSSFVSVDSANFNGDFSAWSSSRRCS